MNAYLAEFIGTTVLVLFGNGVVANVVLAKSKGQSSGWIVIATGWAVAVALAVYMVGRISGAHLNPAVSVALAAMGGFEWAKVPGYVLAQTAGGFTGATLVWVIYYAHWEATPEPGAKLACFASAPAIRKTGPAFVAEALATGALVFGVLALSRVATGAPAGQEAMVSVMSTWFGPALIGLLIFGIGLSLGGPTGFPINPARDFGPRLAHAVLPIAGKGDSDWAYAWVPVVAPFVGGITAAMLFRMLGL
jgi:glycerol uptake facilitator protein